MRDMTCTASIMQTLCCISFLLVLSACASTRESNGVKDESSVFYAVPVGSLLVLNQDLTIPENQVAIYVQGGEIMRYKEVNKYLPNCKFEVYKISEQARIVKADTFTISKVVDDIESSSWQSNVQLAAVNESITDRAQMGGAYHGWNPVSAMFEGSEMFNYATLMYLYSDKQKDVYRLTCQHWESILDNNHLSVTQMRIAMGEIFTLILR